MLLLLLLLRTCGSSHPLCITVAIRRTESPYSCRIATAAVADHHRSYTLVSASEPNEYCTRGLPSVYCKRSQHTLTLYVRSFSACSVSFFCLITAYCISRFSSSSVRLSPLCCFCRCYCLTIQTMSPPLASYLIRTFISRLVYRMNARR